MNRSKAKGTWAETALVRYAQDHGFPHADRQPLRGNRDAGDAHLAPGVIVEVKNHAGGPSLGRPASGVLATWMEQTEVERANADADLGLLVVKRAGTTLPGQWWCYLRMDAFLRMVQAGVTPTKPDAPVCMIVEDVLRQVRRAGWGDPL